jgi:hypothetical protein
MITHQVNEIKLVDDHGKEYTVFEYQEGTEKQSLKWIKAGPSWFRLGDGTAVAKIDDNTFKIDGNPRLVRMKSDVTGNHLKLSSLDPSPIASYGVAVRTLTVKQQ